MPSDAQPTCFILNEVKDPKAGILRFAQNDACPESDMYFILHSSQVDRWCCFTFSIDQCYSARWAGFILVTILLTHNRYSE